MTPGELGAALRRAGLNERAMAAWAGTHRLSVVAVRREALAARAVTPAGAALALFVAGAEVAEAQLRGLDVGALVDHGLVERAGGVMRAIVAVLPLNEGLLVCDRADAPPTRELACWPDDSSYHLGCAASGRRARWLDLACGSAFAAIARPELGESIVGIDLSARSVALARLGIALSGLTHVTIELAAVGDGEPAALRGACALVTCNAPIPEADHATRPMWRATDAGFVGRALADARRFAAPGAWIVVHAALGPLVAALGDHGGERVVVAYTPEATAGFGVAWWRPDEPSRLVVARRALTADAPHVTPADRSAALAGQLR